MNTVLAYPAFFKNFFDYFPDLINVTSQMTYRINYQILGEADLVIFSGGEDISPSIYGEKNIWSRSINSKRDEIELEVLRVALRTGKKILGVCRGHQLIHAYLGGKIVQDISTEFGTNHRDYHTLEWRENRFKLLFEGGVVNSYHHQAVCSLAEGFLAIGFHPNDKTVEFSRSDPEGYFMNNIFTVQFHPEFMNDSSKFFNFIKKWVERK